MTIKRDQGNDLIARLRADGFVPYGGPDGRVTILPDGQGGAIIDGEWRPDVYEIGRQHYARAAVRAAVRATPIWEHIEKWVMRHGDFTVEVRKCENIWHYGYEWVVLRGPLRAIVIEGFARDLSTAQAQAIFAHDQRLRVEPAVQE